MDDDDEADMTWVEYHWLARTNYESPRMVSTVPNCTTSCRDGPSKAYIGGAIFIYVVTTCSVKSCGAIYVLIMGERVTK